MFLKYIVCLFIILSSSKCQDVTQLAEGSPCWDGEKNGTCINLYKCPTAATYYEYTHTGQTNALRYLSEPQVCSHREDGEPIVCCTDCTLDENETFRNYTVLVNGVKYRKPKKSKAFEKCMEYMRELPYPCRGDSSDKFSLNYIKKLKCDYLLRSSFGLGGYAAKKWQFPHMALLGYGTDHETAQWLCGGAVISERFILTAAHCSSTQTNMQVSYAALGVLTRSEVTDYWKVYKIKNVIVHPEYKAPTKYHDIALLQTVNEINFGKGLLPACLDVGITNTRFGTAPGWGRLGHKGSLAEHLMVMELNQYNETLCSSLYPPHRHLKSGYDKQTQICFGRQDKIVDTCQGDSGGPLHTHILECMYIVFGITSFGKDCGIPGNAGMYTKVLHYVPWIESIVWPDT